MTGIRSSRTYLITLVSRIGWRSHSPTTAQRSLDPLYGVAGLAAILAATRAFEPT